MPGSPHHVLIVEDSEAVSSALRVLIESTGRRVSVAGGVAQAIASARADAPDLVLLDLTLPDGDGLDIARALRADPEPPVLVALTGHDEAEVVRRCEELGCRAVLLKPVPTRELLRKLEEWLDGDGG